MNERWLHTISWFLIIIGAVNWGLTGIGGFAGANWNLVNIILGSWPQVEWIVYILVGLSAVYEFVVHKNHCKLCSAAAGSMSM